MEEEKTVRQSIIEATHSVAEKDEATKAFSEKVNVVELARDKANEAAAARLEPKEQDRSETVRDSIRAAVSPDNEPAEPKPTPQTYDVTNEDKERPGYKFIEDDKKGIYSGLSPDIRSYLDRLANERQQIEARGSEFKYLTEVDEVLKPYVPRLRELNSTPAQLVGALFNYAAALSDPNQKYEAFAEICASYGIDPATLTDPRLQRLNAVEQHFHAQEQHQHNQAQAQQVKLWQGADGFVANWSEGKEHFSAVKTTMAGLIATNRDKFIKNGTVDLDGAYSAACKALGLAVAPIVERKPSESQHQHKPNRPNPKPSDSSVRGAIRAAFNERGQNA